MLEPGFHTSSQMGNLDTLTPLHNKPTTVTDKVTGRGITLKTVHGFGFIYSPEVHSELSTLLADIYTTTFCCCLVFWQLCN